MLVPFVCVGDPNVEFSYRLVKALEPFSDLIELGIPFSDPIADGKTIQEASDRAIKNGMSVKKVFLFAQKLKKNEFSKPLVFMTYYNIVHSFGQKKFFEEMKKNQVDSLIVVDLPFEHDKKFEKLARYFGVSLISLVTENMPKEKVKRIFEKKAPFVYLVSSKGVTGTRQEVSEKTVLFVKRIRKIAGQEKKLCVGFGVSKKSHVKKLVQAGADGVIVGSKIISIYSDAMQSGENENSALKSVECFVAELKKN